MSQCLYCERRVHARKMCQAHWGRWWRNGDPLLKRRNRGILDVPAVQPLGPVQAKILITLVQNPGRAFPRHHLYETAGGVYAAIYGLRKRYGPNVITTASGGKGYYIEPETAKRLLAITQ